MSINRCLRFIMRIWWPRVIPNVELREKLNQQEIWKELNFSKWQWIGHVSRREDVFQERHLCGIQEI